MLDAMLDAGRVIADMDAGLVSSIKAFIVQKEGQIKMLTRPLDEAGPAQKARLRTLIEMHAELFRCATKASGKSRRLGPRTKFR